MTGADVLVAALDAVGIRHVFGLPGTQSIPLYEALRRSGIRTVLATSELGASFMANGYYRASRRVAALATIPGPGFAYAVPGIAEAHADSVAVLWIVPDVTEGDGVPGLQGLDHESIARPITRGIVRVESCDTIGLAVAQALELATVGEPGPVLLRVPATVFSAECSPDGGTPNVAGPNTPAAGEIAEAASLLAGAGRIVVLCGLGAVGAAEQLKRFVESRGAAVVTTPSARGVLPEDHPLSLRFEYLRDDVSALNLLLAVADRVLLLGARLGYNGTGGYRLRIPWETTIRVDANPDTAAAGPPQLAICGDAEDVLLRLEAESRLGEARSLGGWTASEIEEWRRRMTAVTAVPEPLMHGMSSREPAHFFRALRRALPRDAILVTDSGLHQNLVRRYFEVNAPAGLMLPSDFQSMGFGIPAAIGARLADPGRPVIALVGDGGFAMSALELLTAVREGVPLTVIVFNDGNLNLIRLQQVTGYGRESAVAIRNPDFEALMVALGGRYVLADGDVDEVLARALGSEQPALLEVRLGDSPSVHVARLKGLARGATRRAIGGELYRRLRRLIRGGGRIA
jgi:acetolactate synthase-1/2/3 large subunit